MPTRTNHTYIIRLWKENNQEKNWRWQVQNGRTGRKMLIKDFDELVAFLHGLLDEGPDQPTENLGGLR